ncbi:hypothetical protein QUT25_22460, partial [Xanthomonas citri pv. citri]
MLFNSYPFILLFLPVVLAGYFWLGRRSNLAPVIWLALASLAFYAIGSWQFVALLLLSIAFNYGVGHLLIVAKLTRRSERPRSRSVSSAISSCSASSNTPALPPTTSTRCSARMPQSTSCCRSA